MPSEPEVVDLPIELVRGVTGLARALVTAARGCALYPPEHPAIQAAHQQLADAIQKATSGAVFSVGVTPETLLLEGRPVPIPEPVTEAAKLLHDRDLLRLTFSGAVPIDAVRTLVRILCLDATARRDRGGPSEIWAREGRPSITLEQVDYGRVLEDRDQDENAPKHDDVWQSIVSSIVGGHKTMDELEQQRILSIAADPAQIGELAAEVMAPRCALDGSPMITTQAITVLAAFRHLASIVSVKSPDQLQDLMRNLVTATSSLDPNLIVEMIRSGDDPADTVKVVQGMSAAFDDMQVAQLLATAVAAEGQATARLAEVFDAIAPDPERKRRTLAMAHTLLNETDFGQKRHFTAIWSSIEQLLLSYNETPFVSDSYRTALAGTGGRATAVAGCGVPEEISEWMDSLGQNNVRRLSVTLIVDLLSLERDPVRAAEIAADMTLLAEDLLMSADYAGARDVAIALDAATVGEEAIAPAACREALEALAASAAVQETVAFLGEFEADPMEAFAAMCRAIGPIVIDALVEPLAVETDSAARRRATDIAVAFGPPAVAHLAPLLDDARPFVQCHGADMLGRIAAPDAVPLLQPLLRRGNPLVARHAVAALAGIDDPAAARAIHTVLRAATGEVRAAVIAALVAERDVRVVPMLVRILDESQPLGKDHSIVIDALGALKIVYSDRAVPSVARLMRRQRWFSRARTRRLKRTAVEVLVAIGSPAAVRVLEFAAAHGDRLLRRIVKQTRPVEAAS